MNSATNKAIMRQIFAGLAKGDARPFVDAMADDFVWHVSGTTPFSRSYVGKAAVLGELLGPLTAQFADTYHNDAQCFIAEDDHVAVLCKGRVTLKSGLPYNNDYCWVCRLEGGKLRELTEYLDTALVMSVLR
jgi:uncharacterized protein